MSLPKYSKEDLTDDDIGSIQRWRMWSVATIFLPIVLFHSIKWIVTGKLTLQPLIADYLLMGFSLAVNILGMADDLYDSCGGKYKNDFRRYKFLAIAGSIAFFVFSCVYQIVSIYSEIRTYGLIIFLLVEVVLSFVNYKIGIRLRITSSKMNGQVSDEE